MKRHSIISALFFLISIQAYGQYEHGVFHLGTYETDTSKFEQYCKTDFKLKFRIPKGYEDLIFYGPAIGINNFNSCLNRNFAKRIRNIKYDVIVGFSFNPALSLAAEARHRELIDPSYDRNKNYLGKQKCENERRTGWISIFTSEDFRKMNADTAFCFKGSSDVFRPYLGKYDSRIAVVMHKYDRGDITVQFLYRKGNEEAVLREVKDVWKMISYE